MTSESVIKKKFREAADLGLLMCYRGYKFAEEMTGTEVVQVFVKMPGIDNWVFRFGKTDVEVSEDGKVVNILGDKKNLKEIVKKIDMAKSGGLFNMGRSLILKGNPGSYMHAKHPAVANMISGAPQMYNGIIIPALLELINVQGVKPEDIAKEISKTKMEKKGMFGSKEVNLEASGGRMHVTVKFGDTRVTMPVVNRDDIVKMYKMSKANAQLFTLFAVMGDKYVPGMPFMMVKATNSESIPPVGIQGDMEVAMKMAGPITSAMAVSLWEKYGIKGKK
jgi:hypothetical protein